MLCMIIYKKFKIKTPECKMSHQMFVLFSRKRKTLKYTNFLGNFISLFKPYLGFSKVVMPKTSNYDS